MLCGIRSMGMVCIMAVWDAMIYRMQQGYTKLSSHLSDFAPTNTRLFVILGDNILYLVQTAIDASLHHNYASLHHNYVCWESMNLDVPSEEIQD